MCILLTGYAPYQGYSPNETKLLIRKGGRPINDSEWENHSEEAQNFVTLCL